MNPILKKKSVSIWTKLKVKRVSLTKKMKDISIQICDVISCII